MIKQRLPADPDVAAAFTLADLSDPSGSYPPEKVVPDYQARMEAAGIVYKDGFSEQGFLLQSLTRRAVILETAWMQEVRNSTDPRLTPSQRGTAIRSMSRLNEDLNKTLTLIMRVRTAQGEDTAPFLSANEQALADDPRAENILKQRPGLTIPQIVQAELQGEEIYEAEFRESKPKP